MAADSKDRARLRAELDARAARRDARALNLAQKAERKQDRAETKRQRAEDRRAAIRTASYALAPNEVVELCQTATASVPLSSRDDVSQALALEIMRRHGTEPNQADIGADWLRVRAQSHYVDSLRSTERATGAIAAARELPTADDPVYVIATDRGIAHEVETLTVERIVASLPSLTDRQRSTVRTWLGDRAEPLTNLERQHFHAAMSKLRASSPKAIRRALRADMAAARELVDRAIVAEMARADVASRGC